MLMSFVFLASCSAVGPDYRSPDIGMPSAFRNPGFHSPVIQTSDPWWETFQDPVLTRLVEDAVRHNQDIRIAGRGRS
jgi:multidrug efflux system outer membrane protein